MLMQIMASGTFANLGVLLLCFLVTVKCNVHGQPADGSLRLVGGLTLHEGTVLIYHLSSWGAICDDHWDIKDAHVVCNELGFAGAKGAPRKSQFGKHIRKIWLSGLHCRGNERHLTMCHSRGWNNHTKRCNSSRSFAGAICFPNSTKDFPADSTDIPISSTTFESLTKPVRKTRTKNVDKKKENNYRISSTVNKSNNTTTTTTTTTTQPPPTTLQSLTNAATITITTSTNTTSLTSFTTTATTITQRPPTRLVATAHHCKYDRWVYNREMWRYFMCYRNGSFVTSKPDNRYFHQSTTASITKTTTPPQPSQPRDNISIYNRLVGGNTDNNTQSPDIINNNMNTRHLEMKNGYVGDQPEFVVNTKSNNLSGDNNDIQVEATQLPTNQRITPLFTEFRLVGGRDHTGYKEGRLEVRLAGSNAWGVICGDNWSFRAAIVTCKHFGAGYARMNQTNDFYGGSHMDKVLANVRCTGREQRLEDCAMETTELIPGTPKCSRPGSVAGVICETRLPDLEADVKAVAESVFLRDRYLYYLQCAYEEKCLSASAYSLHGTRSWAYATRRLLHFSTIAKNIGKADFRPFIDRSKWDWHACHQHYHSMEAFSHYDIIDEHGNRIAEGHKASFCLEDSRCDRGVHPKYNCQNYGHQGISVGCQDSYLADIDCQWIDVTDVPAGQYKLKIEINPDMKVPEISYDNNVISCDLYFNTHQARAWNCKLESLL